MRILPTCLLLTLLAACAGQREICVARETRDLQVIDSLIAQQEAILERGYALERETVVRNRVQFCTGIGTGLGYDGLYGGLSVGGACIRPEPETRLIPQAVDLSEVQERLDGLRERREVVARRTAQAVAACTAQYP